LEYYCKVRKNSGAGSPFPVLSSSDLRFFRARGVVNTFSNFPAFDGIVYKVSTPFIMHRFFVFASIAVVFSTVAASAQAVRPEASLFASSDYSLPVILTCKSDCSTPALSESVPLVSQPTLPRMGPELALQVYRNRTNMQMEQLSSYSATSVIRAQLPDTQQSGEFELQRHYSAPRSLAFRAVRFTGDNFVKSNVILRILQSEASHVEKDDPSLNALSAANYKFSYKGTSQLEGRVVHVYHVKPRHNRPGLFKGRIYLDAFTGSMIRAEGRLAKSPSIFLKQVEFVQDYADVDEFTLPLHMHSDAKARIVGRVVVDIQYSDYHVSSGAVQARTAP